MPRMSLVAQAILFLTLCVSVYGAPPYDNVCRQIAAGISSASNVYYPGSSQYARDIYHFMTSSTQKAACSVEPGTAVDVGVILRILGSTRTPFAVRGGGHASNPGFSSTPGVQIAMYRFSEVTYDPSSQTVAIGAGLIWDDVYAALEPHGVGVVGGRTTGVGVAGFILGGGYSWKTNQYGLAIDTVQAFELVLPDGNITTVTPTSNVDLFFGLRGAFNNFGIVTKFVMKAFPQTEVWGGLITYPGDSITIDAVTAATNKFSDTNTDPRANIITTYNFALGFITFVNVLVFYDARKPPQGVFDDFLAIPAAFPIVDTLPLTSLVVLSAANVTQDHRGAFETVSLTGYPIDLLDFIVQELVNSSSSLDGVFFSYDVEPFLPSLLAHSIGPSAYPPSRSQALLPLNLYFAWLSRTSDGVFHDAIRRSAASIKAKAIALGQDVANASVYPNYALYDTPLENIYGQNLQRLRGIKEQYDPHDVMGLTGGFKLG